MNRSQFLERFRGEVALAGVAAGGDVRRRGDADLNPGFKTAGRLIPAAVLVPIVDRGSELTVILTRRTDDLPDHAGQISFPGGRQEPGDGGPEGAALRETEEEIGLGRAHVTLLGRLDEYVTGTGFSVIPVVGLVEPPFTLTPGRARGRRDLRGAARLPHEPGESRISRTRDQGARPSFLCHALR